MAAFHERLTHHLAPRGGKRQWREIVRQLLRMEPLGGTSAEGALRDVAVRLRRRGLVILISDLLVDPEETRVALRFLRHRGHEVLVFHLVDPGERELPASSDARFFDPETLEEIQVRVADFREEYRQAVDHAPVFVSVIIASW